MRTLLILLFAFPSLSFAHKEPKTDHEVEIQRSLQAAAYFCAPAVAEFTASRKRLWAQKVLAGTPLGYLPGFNELFAQDTYDDTRAISDRETMMSCSSAQDTKIENNTCVLTPETTDGPYHHPQAHPIRQHIAEYQSGLLLLLDIGVIDVEACRPLPNVLVDIWQANATGFYSGHPVPEPHLVDEKPQVDGRRAGLLTKYPFTTPEETWLRGAWPTDRNGVAQFTTTYPGYYTGRAVHIHAKVHPEWQVHPNGTFTPGRLVHTGQFFFDENVNIEVDKMWPYSENPVRDLYGRKRNWDDGLNIFGEAHGPEGEYDPVFRLHLLGGIINQGLLGYITMGVNASASYPL